MRPYQPGLERLPLAGRPRLRRGLASLASGLAFGRGLTFAGGFNLIGGSAWAHPAAFIVVLAAVFREVLALSGATLAVEVSAFFAS